MIEKMAKQMLVMYTLIKRQERCVSILNHIAERSQLRRIDGQYR